jgi:hypothetical protein
MTIKTMAAIMVSDRTREKPERLRLIVKWGKIRVTPPREMSKDRFLTFVPKYCKLSFKIIYQSFIII